MSSITTHKVFLSWLIYFVVVVLIGLGLLYLGIPQIAILGDHSYLTIVLLGMYAVAEIISGRQAWKISKEHLVALETKKWLNSNVLTDFSVNVDDSVTLFSDGNTFIVPVSETSNHFIGLRDMAADGNQVDQSILLNVLSNHLHNNISIVKFLAGRVLLVGILATILGIVLAFWPLLSTGMAIEAMRLKLGGFFAGMAVAFIPTAVSFVFKIALDFGTKILTSGGDEITNLVARIGETKILPFLQRKNRGDGK